MRYKQSQNSDQKYPDQKHPVQRYSEQDHLRQKSSAQRSRGRFLVYFCGLIAITFAVLIFLFRDQIVAPLATDVSAGSPAMENAAQSVGQAVELVSESPAVVDAEGTISNAAESAIKSPSAQLMDTSLAEVNAAESSAESQTGSSITAATTERVVVDDGGAGGSIDDAGSVDANSVDAVITAADPTSSVVDSPTTRPATALRPGTQFAINQSVDNAKVANIIFAVRSAEVTADELILTAAFENIAQKATRFSRIDAVPLEQIRLLDSAGGLYPATAATPMLLAIQPTNGFAPQGANIGQIRFALPNGPGPYTLSGIHNYPAIQITAEMVASASATVAQGGVAALLVPDGNYEIYTQVASSLQELKPLVLHVRTIHLTPDSLNLHIGFSNNTLQRFGLLSGPNGTNAWLLDKAQRQYAPHTVSETLRELITPKQGIAPGEEYQGTLTFPRPTDLTELQFVLEPYMPVTVRFGPGGINEILSGGVGDGAEYVTLPAANTTGVQAYREINALLEQTSAAVMSVQQDSYVAGFSQPMQDWHANVFKRLGKLPLTSFEIELLVPAQLEGLNVQTPDSISTPNLDVQLKYNLSEISADNPFVYDFTVSLARVDNRWMITNFVPKRNQPFWWGNDFSLFETAHFLIFTRPNSVQNLQNLQLEVETAYAALEARGLPLERKYVAYFTGQEDSLYALTGMANTHLVGVALSRYDINGRDPSSGERTINAINRAFYVNSEQFAIDPSSGGDSLSLRQSIITHELVHLAFAYSARPFTPPWLSEGMAVYYSEQFVLADAVRYNQQGNLAQITLNQLTGLETLGDHDLVGQETEMRYIYSSAVVSYLIETFGEAQVQALFRAYASIPAEYIEQRMPQEQDGGTTRVAFRQMSIDLTSGYVASYFGLTLPELDQRVKSWLAAQ